MSDLKTLLERADRAVADVPLPAGGLEGLEHRRDRKRRNQRIRAGVLGLAIAVFVGWWGIHTITSTTPKPADDRSEELGIFAPVAGRIVYGNQRGIWGIDPTSADPGTTVLLTSEAGTPLAWSSDGTELLILRRHLFVLHADGSETQVTTGAMNISDATISPDGSRVVFAGEPEHDAAPSALYAVDADGGPAHLLVESQIRVVKDPTFSPDGTRIAYADDNSDVDHSVWVMNADGSDVHQILSDETMPGAGHVYGLAWSPAGDRIALGFEGTTYTFAPDGSGFTQVIDRGDTPYWSPDGSRIAYTVRWPYTDTERGVLAIAGADGSNDRDFSFANSGPWHPAAEVADASPAPASTQPRRNGEVLVFTRRLGTGPGWDLAAKDPETGEVRKMVETDGIVDCQIGPCTSYVKSAEWSADGRWVAFEVTFGSLDAMPRGPCGPTAGLWVQGPVGGPRQLTTPCEATPGAEEIEELWAWSPVGARLAYVRVDDENDELFVIDPSDGSRTLRVSGGGTRTALAWSPDGTRIAFASGDAVSEVAADVGGEVAPSGAGLRLLGRSFEDVIDIDYSPDGTQIMVHDRLGQRIQVMNADRSDLHVVIEGEDGCCDEAAWSPNGDRIVYQLSIDNGTEDFDSEVWTIAPDGSNRIEVFDSKGCDMGGTQDALPVWAPNGTQVAYNACGMWVVANADGTGEPQPGDALMHRSWDGGWLHGWDLYYEIRGM
jgi:Tol biopolymer transport system component